MALVCPSINHRTRCKLPLCFLSFWSTSAVSYGTSGGCVSQRFLMVQITNIQLSKIVKNAKLLLTWQVCEGCHQTVINPRLSWPFSSNRHIRYGTKKDNGFLEKWQYQVSSALCMLSVSVPQGSQLGPLLFFHYTCSLSEVIFSHTTAVLDESLLLLFFPPSDAHVSACILECLAVISSWMAAYQLKHNPSKTEMLNIPGDASRSFHLSEQLSNHCT